ncbi:HAD domain-containing protein, partial [Klebsiella pneumoniae]|uniref:HAD domain-containing protein n=1 Tax=Klebsiella pneumoniae TaxID=573 RepID=UPI0038551793
IVVSSAWRYVTSDPKVFEYILLISGVNAYEKVIGATHLDERYIDNRPSLSDVEAWYKLGLKIRPMQIRDWIMAHKVKSYVVLDDLPLE